MHFDLPLRLFHHLRPRRRIGLFALLDIARQRRALTRLEGHLLRDIGLTQSEAQEEASRAAWDVPRHWRR